MNKEVKLSLRKRGKQDIKKYYALKMNKFLDALILLLSLICAGVVLLPIILIVVNLFQIFSYMIGAILLLIVVSMLGLMIFNGISNFCQIEIAKLFIKDKDLQEIDSKAVFVYECTNFGFFLFLILILMFYSCVM